MSCIKNKFLSSGVKIKDDNDVEVKNYTVTIRHLATGKITNETMLNFKKRVDKLPIGEYQIKGEYYKMYENKVGKKINVSHRTPAFNFTISSNKETAQTIYFMPLSSKEIDGLEKYGPLEKQ